MPLLIPPRTVIRPLFHPTVWVPPHLSAQFPCCHPLPANMKGPGIEKQNPSRRVRRLPPSKRFELQGLEVVPNWTCLLNMRSFLANAPNVATCSGKQTHSEGQCRQQSAVYYTGGPKAASPLSQRPWGAFLKTLYTLSVCAKPTSPNSLKLVWTKEKKDTIKVNPWFICLKPR